MTDRPLHTDDLALVQAALANDLAAKERLARRLGCVGRFLKARNRALGGRLDAHDLEDTASDTIATVLKKLPTYSGLASFESWVFLFVEGELRNAIRRRWRRLQRETEEVAEPAGPTEESPDLPEDLFPCMQHLDAEELQLVRWKHYQDLTLDAIARQLAAKLNTIKSRYFRVLKKLEDCLLRRARGGES